MDDTDAGRDDRASWIREALERYEGPLIRYAARFTSDTDQARDVVQDTFMRLCRTDRTLVEGRLGAWLYTVCRNRAIDVRRKEGQMKTVDEVTAAAFPSREPSPSAMAERHETHTEVLQVLGALPPNQQEVIRLKFEAGLSYKEISSVTGLSTTNVGYLIHMGVKALREHFRLESGAVLGEGRSAP